MIQKEITYVPGLYKIFDEILGEDVDILVMGIDSKQNDSIFKIPEN